MKKVALCIFLIGLIVAAAAIGVGILVRDNEEVQAISEVTNIPITPERGEELHQAALNLRLKMSGIVDFLLRVYPYITKATMIGAACAAFGLLLLILVIIIKPVLSIILLLAIAAVLYFGYQGALGPEVSDFVNMIISNVQDYMSRLVSFVKELPIGETINNLVSH